MAKVLEITTQSHAESDKYLVVLPLEVVLKVAVVGSAAFFMQMPASKLQGHLGATLY